MKGTISYHKNPMPFSCANMRILSRWRRILVTVATAIILLSQSGCEDPDRALTRAERRLIDSFYRKKILVLQGELDSICKVRHDSIFQSKFDSILKKRKAERLETMGKYRAKYFDHEE